MSLKVTHVKLCGFQTLGPAIAAIDAGVDSLGFVFVPAAHRRLGIHEADALLGDLRKHIGTGQAPEIVGLFADQSVEDVQAHIDQLKLDAVQLCGAEDVTYARQLSVPVYKVITVDPDVPISAQIPRIMVLQQRHQLAGHRVVIDTKVAGEYGGTGRRFDWQLAADLAEGFDMNLAGGLTPDNVGDAVMTVKPWGVDASSGVETDGKKDSGKVRAFVEAVRAVDKQASRGLIKRLLGRK
jgi:phosphoribosylanthranilate isomerase